MHKGHLITAFYLAAGMAIAVTLGSNFTQTETQAPAASNRTVAEDPSDTAESSYAVSNSTAYDPAETCVWYAPLYEFNTGYDDHDDYEYTDPLGQRYAGARASARGGTIFQDDFESGATGWTFSAAINDVAWAVDATPSTYPGGITPSGSGSSLNYNNITDGADYAGTGANNGYAQSPAINLSGSTNPVLLYYTNYNTETRGTQFDQRFVEIRDSSEVLIVRYQLASVGYSFTDDDTLVGVGPGPSAEAYEDLETGAPITAWHEQKIYLDPAWGTIHIRFVFDTVDDLRNGYGGWAIDDLVVQEHPNAFPTGWPDAWPDDESGDGDGDDAEFNHLNRTAFQNLLKWSWGINNNGDPDVDLIIGNHPDSLVDDSFLFYHAAPGHNHFHFSQYADFSLWRDLPSVGFTKVARGPKRSFCIRDTEKNFAGAPNSRSPNCNGDWQAITYGWQDVYGLGTPGQSMSLDGLPSNVEYYLIGVLDPLNRVRETNEFNQIDNVRFTMPAVFGNFSPTDHSNPFPQSTDPLSITSVEIGSFNGKLGIHVLGTGFDTALYPLLYDSGIKVVEAPFYTILSTNEIWVQIPDEIDIPASVDLIRASGHAVSARLPDTPALVIDTIGIGGSETNRLTENGVYLLLAGETVDLTATVSNVGIGVAVDVEGVLSEQAPGPELSITADTAQYGDINSGQTATQNTAYQIQVAPDIEQPADIVLVLTLTDDNDQTWIETITVRVLPCGELVNDAEVGKGRFKVHFNKTDRDMLKLTLSHPGLAGTKAAKGEGAVVDGFLMVDGHLAFFAFDTFKGRTTKDSAVQVAVNNRTGKVTIKMKNANLLNMLSGAGAVNQTISDTVVSVPIILCLGTNDAPALSSTVNFNYKATENKNGRGGAR